MGLTYGPLGTVLSGAFPDGGIGYTGSSLLTFNLAGIFGASHGAIHRHVARQNLRATVRWLLPHGL